MRKYSIYSAVFGAASAVPGILLAYALSLPPGPVVVVVGITIFAATVLMNWRMKLTT